MQNPLIGVSGPHPWDYPQVNNFLKTLNPTYTCPYIDYDVWMNGTSHPSWDGPKFYDAAYNLNQGYKMILGFSPIPLDKIATFVPMVLARYPNVWGVAPVLEQNAAISIAQIKEFRRVLPNARLVGPNLYTSYRVDYMDALLNGGAIACLDVLAMHDYFGCPGRGTSQPQPWGVYFHPTDPIHTDVPITPNLRGRIAWLKSYLKYTRKVFKNDHDVIYTEFGLFVNDPNDAKTVAQISKETNVPIVLSSPNTPSGPTSVSDFANGVYGEIVNGAFTMDWSLAIKNFLAEMETKFTLNTAQKVKMSADARSKNGNQSTIYNINWSTSNNYVVSLSPLDYDDVMVTAVNPGSVQISVEAMTGNKKLTSNIYVLVNPK